MKSWGKFGAPHTRARRVIRGGTAGSFIAVLALAAAPLASAHRTRVTPAAAQGHPYRQGVVPPRGHQAAGAASSSGNLFYGGGIDNVGVTTGSPQVYVVFWGSQWGTAGTDGQGSVTFSGDPKGMAPYLQAFIKGLGTGTSDANTPGAST